MDGYSSMETMNGRICEREGTEMKWEREGCEDVNMI
jgi:hypothetical protein